MSPTPPDLAGIAALRKALLAEKAVLRVIAPAGGTLHGDRSSEIVERTLLTTRSVEFDAVVIAGGTAGLRDVKLTVLLQEAFRHCKPLAAWGNGAQVLVDAGIDATAPGIVLAGATDGDLAAELVRLLGLHRVWDRAQLVMAG